jgi:hypothetical protein
MFSGKTAVTALVCPACKYTIFSRAGHDYRSCKCGAIGVDGGREYFKASWDATKCPCPEPFEMTVPVSSSQLYDDWRYRHDKYGLIPPKESEHGTTPSTRTDRPRTRRAPTADRKPTAPRRKNPRG